MNISTFFGLNVGMSALDTMQQAEDVVANNISNANTTGYVRETASFGEQGPFPTVPANDAPLIHGQLGQGSLITQVTRQTNAFLNEQDRANQGTYAMFQTYSQNLTQIESTINEPSSMSLQNAVDQFFASYQTLSTDPSNTAARQTVISQAQTVAQTFGTVTTQLEQMQSNLSGTMKGQIDQLNSYASQVAQLNQQIANVVQNNESPNQLLDQRGVILDAMSKLANISYTSSSNDMVNITIPASSSGGSATTLVSGTTSTSVSDTIATSNSLLQQITSGSIKGNISSYDQVSQILTNVNSFLQTFAKQVNTIQGSTALYTSTTDSVGNTVLSVPSTFTSANVNTGTSTSDNTNALAMVNLQNNASLTYTSTSFTSLATNTAQTSSMSGTFDQSLGQLVSNLGITAAQANNQQQTANSLAQQSSTLRQSVSSVDINSEAAKMVEYQNSYNAAAKFISVYNAMLNSLIAIIP